MDKIIIRDILARGIIGIHERERTQPQDILINLTIYTHIAAAAAADDITQTVNYSTVAKQVIQLAEIAHRLTVEALAVDIADSLLQLPNVEGAQVRVEKPGAVTFSRSVGVEILRWKSPDSGCCGKDGCCCG